MSSRGLFEFGEGATLNDKILMYLIIAVLILGYPGLKSLNANYTPQGLYFYIAASLSIVVFGYITIVNLFNMLNKRIIATSTRFGNEKLVWFGRIPIIQNIKSNFSLVVLFLLASIVYGVISWLGVFQGLTYMLESILGPAQFDPLSGSVMQLK